MKKIFSLVLSIVLIASVFTACSSGDSNGSSGGSIISNIISSSKPSLSKIDAELCIEDRTNQQMCLKDNLLFVSSEKFYFDYDDSDSESEYSQEIKTADNRFILYDIENNNIICQKDFETKEPLNIFDVSFEGEDKIVVINDEKKTYYDYNLNELEAEKFDSDTYDAHSLGSSDFGDYMACAIKGVYQEYAKNFEAMIFKCDPNIAYVIDKDIKTEYIVCNGKKIITQEATFNDDFTAQLSTTVKVLDFEAQKVLNQHTFTYKEEDNISNVQIDGAFNDNVAVISTSADTIINDNGNYVSSIEFYIWNYNEDSEPEDFKADKYDYNAINDMTKKFSEEISEKYNIFLDYNVDTVPNYDDELTEDDMFYVDFKIKNIISLYDSLIDVENILSNFPEGMVASLDNFSLYIVNYITGCGAYENTYIDETSDEMTYYVVSGYCSISDLPHELMHCFDTYITNHLDDDPLYEPYKALNPEDIFDATYYDNHDKDERLKYVYNGDNKDIAAFVSDYATTNVLEDKAELFQLLYYLGTDYDTYKYDGMEKLSAPIIRKKAEMICKVLREAFPEINDTPVWELGLKRNIPKQ